jgi:hypothetical protein
MKGIVFTEFLEMVESKFGLEVLDRITSLPSLQSGGAYTTVGTYPHAELVDMLDELNRAVGLPHRELIFAFGQSLLRTFSAGHQKFFDQVGNALDFLNGIESVIHTEVRILYTDAVLPYFECERPAPDILIMHYSSSRPFADLAQGLIQETINFYKDPIELVRCDGPTGDAHSAVFTLSRKPA